MVLQEHHTPVASGLVGGFLIGLIGIFLPPTMFWGEFEIRTLANPGKVALPHIWPKGGFYGLSPFLQVSLQPFSSSHKLWRPFSSQPEHSASLRTFLIAPTMVAQYAVHAPCCDLCTGLSPLLRHHVVCKYYQSYGKSLVKVLQNVIV